MKDLYMDDDDMTTQELTPREVTRELRRLSHAVDKITKHLFGNGEEGRDEMLRNATKTVQRLEISFNEYKESQMKKEEKAEQDIKNRQGEREVVAKENRTWLKRFVLVTIVPYAISFITWLVYWIVRLQPLLEELDKVTK